MRISPTTDPSSLIHSLALSPSLSLSASHLSAARAPGASDDDDDDEPPPAASDAARSATLPATPVKLPEAIPVEPARVLIRRPLSTTHSNNNNNNNNAPTITNPRCQRPLSPLAATLSAFAPNYNLPPGCRSGEGETTRMLRATCIHGTTSLSIYT